MFTKSSRFYDAIYGWKDYPAEAEKLHTLIQARRPGARTLLDVACGTGKHLELLREHYEVEGLDVNPEFLAIARQRLPGVPIHEGDMRDFDLGKTFDAVTCLFSSIAYTLTTANLGRAVAAMARHVAPGGVLVVEPFFAPDQWQPGRPWAVFVDEPDLKIARMDVARPLENGVATIEFHFLVGTAGGIERFTERHEVALFEAEQLRAAFRATGLDPEVDPEGLMDRGLYIAVKPG